MTTEEQKAASAALIAWFESQGIEPADSIVIMLGVSGGTIGQTYADVRDVAAEVANAQRLLLASAFGCWREKKGKNK